MKFYTLDGNEIDRTVFVEKYGPSYYIDRPRYIPRVGQSSRPIEDYMDELLKNGVKEPLDVVRILAWKLGKIKHSEQPAYCIGKIQMSVFYLTIFIKATSLGRSYQYRLSTTGTSFIYKRFQACHKRVKSTFTRTFLLLVVMTELHKDIIARFHLRQSFL